mmetsp:Transcript_28132/g.78680  ORF Transcript_28132/g.78680 Transcript_28132/m.78680 type:complete len:236 (-) Transcript_28132:738-1445(-)
MCRRSRTRTSSIWKASCRSQRPGRRSSWTRWSCCGGSSERSASASWGFCWRSAPARSSTRTCRSSRCGHSCRPRPRRSRSTHCRRHHSMRGQPPTLPCPISRWSARQQRATSSPALHRSRRCSRRHIAQQRSGQHTRWHSSRRRSSRQPCNNFCCRWPRRAAQLRSQCSRHSICCSNRCLPSSWPPTSCRCTPRIYLQPLREPRGRLSRGISTPRWGRSSGSTPRSRLQPRRPRW